MREDLIETIDSYAKSQGDAPAYSFNGNTNSYLDLKRNSDALAAYIDRMNLPRNRPLIVFGGKSFDMLVAFIAAAKSGHAYIPVDVNSTVERLEAIQEIAKPVAVIAVSDLPTTLTDLPVIKRDELDRILLERVDYQPLHALKADDTFYIIFTSGTTGKPKGVEISLSNLQSFVNWICSDDFKLPKRLQTLQQPAYSFDLSVMSLYPTLYQGGTLYALSKAVTDNFIVLFTTLPSLPVNVWISTPSFADICLLEPSFDEKHYPELKTFMFCGEELSHKTAENLRVKFPSARIFNTYGPTESTVAMTEIEITDQILHDFERLPIGFTKSGMWAKVVNKDGDQLPYGQKGELVIYGENVSKGYINNPLKNEAAFFTIDGKQAYHTGDVVSMRGDGLLQYFGRSDFQVKLNGYRVELEDVATQLMKNRYIKQAVVVPKYNSQHRVSMLVAYIVPENGQIAINLDLTEAIKADLKKSMMAYMIPQKFVYQKALPLSANGKVNIKLIMNKANLR